MLKARLCLSETGNTIQKGIVFPAMEKIASIKEEMMKKNPSNILQGLRGAAAGVMVTAQDGAPDANAAIRIRGVALSTVLQIHCML